MTRPARSAPAWGCKELLRQLLAQHERDGIRSALWRFYTACAEANMRETTRLALTIETWWPAILVALTERVTSARTEGFNRLIKQVKRVACGFRNMDNYQRRIMHTSSDSGNPSKVAKEGGIGNRAYAPPFPPRD